MPAPRRALPSPTHSAGSTSNCTSPVQYQAVSTPTRNSQELELELLDAVVRSRSHSHALSAILGGTNPRASGSQEEWRPSQQPQAVGEEKTELPPRLARWRRRRRRWRKILFWLAAGVVFVGWFALSFAAPWKFHRLAPVVIGSSLSLVTTFLVMVSFLRKRRQRRRPNELLAFVALSEFGLALLSLIHVLTKCSADTGECRPLEFGSCTFAVGLEMFLLLAGVGWFGAAILHLFVSVSNPFASYKRQLMLSHMLVWGISLVASIVTPLALFSEATEDAFELSGAQVCRMVALVLPMLPADATERRSQRMQQWQDLNLEFWSVLVAIVVLVVVAAQLSLVVGWWRSNSGTVIALKARRRLMKRMAVFVHALNATWLILLVLLFVYRSSTMALDQIPAEGAAQPDNGQMNALDAIFHFVLTGKGFITAAVWVYVNKPCCALGFILCGIHQCSDDDGPSVGISGSGSSQSASLSGSSSGNVGASRATHLAVLPTTVISMDANMASVQQPPAESPAATAPNFDAHESIRESSVLRIQDRHSLPSLSAMVGPRSTSSSSSASYEASTVESWEVSQNNETLQREIIYYTVCGITKAIIRSAERAKAATGASDAYLRDENATDSPARGRDGTLVETTLFVGAERDSTLANSSFISHVQNVTMLSSPRAYCQPRTLQSPSPTDTFRQSILENEFASPPKRERPSQVRPTSFAATSNANLWGPLHLEHSRSQGSQSPQRSRVGLSSTMFHSFDQTPGRYSLYPVSQVPFELFEQEIELQSTVSSVDEENRHIRSAVLAGLRRTASSAFSQGRGVFRARSGSTEAAIGRASAIGKEFVPDDPKPKVFVDYAPREFRAIRLAFGLSDEKYLASFRTTAKERVSAGSSGAFMFFSGDNSLLVKSLKEKECRALVEMAPVYARYLVENPHSRLIRFFGCHRVRLYGRNFYFAVMSNVLHNDQHTATITEKYDVKGSWVDRRARRPQRGDRVTCSECDASYTFGGRHDDDTTDGAAELSRLSVASDHFVPQFPFHVHRPDIVFKDLDLVHSLHLPRHVAEHLHAQVVSDCEFLRDLGIMDYSLLIGVHKCHLRAPRSDAAAVTLDGDAFTHETNIEDPCSGKNLAPLGEDEVYFVGIIDILQQWDWEKQLEKAGKVLLGKSARGISAVAPAAYCRRFQARCTQILLGGGAPEDLDLDWEIDPVTTSAKAARNSKKANEMETVAGVGDQA